MRFLADENWPEEVVLALRDASHDVLSVREVADGRGCHRHRPGFCLKPARLMLADGVASNARQDRRCSGLNEPAFESTYRGRDPSVRSAAWSSAAMGFLA